MVKVGEAMTARENGNGKQFAHGLHEAVNHCL